MATFACVASAGVVSRADVVMERSLDRWLLLTDAVFAATVVALTERKATGAGEEDAESAIVNVRLSNARIAYSRWPTAPTSFLVRGELSSDGGSTSVRPDRRDEALILGASYVFFLHGGEYRVAPYEIASTFPVDEAGRVRCLGGYVYGMNSRGVHCSRSDEIAGGVDAAQREGAFLRNVAAAFRDAASRYPSFAAERARTPEPLHFLED